MVVQQIKTSRWKVRSVFYTLFCAHTLTVIYIKCYSTDMDGYQSDISKSNELLQSQKLWIACDITTNRLQHYNRQHSIANLHPCIDISDLIIKIGDRSIVVNSKHILSKLIELNDPELVTPFPCKLSILILPAQTVSPRKNLDAPAFRQSALHRLKEPTRVFRLSCISRCKNNCRRLWVINDTLQYFHMKNFINTLLRHHRLFQVHGGGAFVTWSDCSITISSPILLSSSRCHWFQFGYSVQDVQLIAAYFSFAKVFGNFLGAGLRM